MDEEVRTGSTGYYNGRPGSDSPDQPPGGRYTAWTFFAIGMYIAMIDPPLQWLPVGVCTSTAEARRPS